MSGVQSLSAIAARSTPVIIAEQLRERIIDGSFGPGEQLGEAQIAAQLSVSRGPVREALNRLVQEGLLISRPNRGVFVAETRPHDVAEVYEAREVIECAAAETVTRRHASERLRAAERLEAPLADMREAVTAADWTRLGRAELDFHTRLVEEGGNARLLRAYATLATETLICMQRFGHPYSDPARLVASHERILELLRDGDMDALHLALHEHLRLPDHELHTHDSGEQLRHGRDD